MSKKNFYFPVYSHFVNSHFVNPHLVNVDKVGIDELGSWQKLYAEELKDVILSIWTRNTHKYLYISTVQVKLLYKAR